jgi:hypothetical protein
VKQLTIGAVMVLLLCAGGTRVEAQAIASSFDQFAVLVKPRDALILVTSAGPRPPANSTWSRSASVEAIR